jgi:hypothetical protein
MPKRLAEPSSTTNFSNDDIIAIVREIAASNAPVKERARTFGRRYTEFAEAFPHLFEMATSPNFDVERLIYMLELRARIQANETTVDKASTEIGQKMFDVYVKDMVKDMPPKNE